MTDRLRRRLPGNGWPLAGLIAVLVVVGIVLLVIGSRTSNAPPTSAEVTDLRTGLPVPEPALAEGTPKGSGGGPDNGEKSVEMLPRSVPVRLDIPAIKVRTRVVQVGLKPDGTVEVPPLEHNSPAVGTSTWPRRVSSGRR